jgi:hypothetical protein
MPIVGERRWRTEAFGAVAGDADWSYVTAGVTPDGSSLYALYEHRMTSKRRTVLLMRDRFRTLPERLREIRRRLRIDSANSRGLARKPTRRERQHDATSPAVPIARLL